MKKLIDTVLGIYNHRVYYDLTDLEILLSMYYIGKDYYYPDDFKHMYQVPSTIARHLSHMSVFEKGLISRKRIGKRFAYYIDENKGEGKL